MRDQRAFDQDLLECEAIRISAADFFGSKPASTFAMVKGMGAF
jgi:hypothetical protein